MFDAKISLLTDAPAPLVDLARVRLHAGTAEVLARVRILGPGSIEPGGEGYAQFRLEKPTVVVPGDRFIFRRYSPATTLGGGIVLDASPAKRRRAGAVSGEDLAGLEGADEAARAHWMIRARGSKGIGGPALARRLGIRWPALAGRLKVVVGGGAVLQPGASGELLISREGYTALRDEARSLLRAFHTGQPLLRGIGLEELRSKLAPGMAPEAVRALLSALERDAVLRIEKDLVCLPDHKVSLSGQEGTTARVLSELFLKAALAPPDAVEALSAAGARGPAGEAVLAHLLREGTLRRLRDGALFHREALEDLKKRIHEYRERSETIDVAAFKELAGVSRKHAIPLLEFLDEEKVTLRRGNERVILGTG